MRALELAVFVCGKALKRIAFRNALSVHHELLGTWALLVAPLVYAVRVFCVGARLTLWDARPYVSFLEIRAVI